MRFMMLMIPGGHGSAVADMPLDPARADAMTRYNDDLRAADVLVTLDGLHPPSTGVRVSFAAGRPVVTLVPSADRVMCWTATG